MSEALTTDAEKQEFIQAQLPALFPNGSGDTDVNKLGAATGCIVDIQGAKPHEGIIHLLSLHLDLNWPDYDSACSRVEEPIPIDQYTTHFLRFCDRNGFDPDKIERAVSTICRSRNGLDRAVMAIQLLGSIEKFRLVQAEASSIRALSEVDLSTIQYRSKDEFSSILTEILAQEAQSSRSCPAELQQAVLQAIRQSLRQLLDGGEYLHIYTTQEVVVLKNQDILSQISGVGRRSNLPVFLRSIVRALGFNADSVLRFPERHTRASKYAPNEFIHLLKQRNINEAVQENGEQILALTYYFGKSEGYCRVIPIRCFGEGFPSLNLWITYDDSLKREIIDLSIVNVERTTESNPRQLRVG